MGTSSANMRYKIIASAEVRRHNGQCAYGEWTPLSDAPAAVQEAVADEIVEAHCRDMRHEPHGNNTDEAGSIEVGGQRWLYRD